MGRYRSEGRYLDQAGLDDQTKDRHSVPLSAPARQLLAEILAEAELLAKAKDRLISAYVFPGRIGGHRMELKKDWTELCAAAGISGARMHDLRHTFASMLAN